MLKDKILSASGGGVDPIYVDDVFSTWLYTGNGSTQTITNGIDLAGKGGLVWLKTRSVSGNNWLFDTVRGANVQLRSNTTDAQSTVADSLTAFNSNGFSIGNAVNIVNTNNATYASWTFREAEKFFDVVTYTGNGVTGRVIPHNLGSVPGCIIVKSTSGGTTDYPWMVYHRSLGATQYINLDSTNPAFTWQFAWNNTAPTATGFTVVGNSYTNQNGQTYVAYLFAHDAGGFGATGNDNVISCGSVSMPPSGGAVTVDLGYEPQWVIAKDYRHTGGLQWFILDNMRGWPATNTSSLPYNYLQANTSNAEATSNSNGWITPTGFVIPGGFNYADGNTDIIYIAIRRPHKPPTSGTEVFDPDYNASFPQPGVVTTGFVVDWNIYKRTGGSSTIGGTRLTGGNYLFPTATSAETTGSNFLWDSNTGLTLQSLAASGDATINWAFRRAPGFFDVVCYTGTGVARTVEHNLGVAPELMIVKRRNSATSWFVFHTFTGSDYKRQFLNDTAAQQFVTYTSSDGLGGQPTNTGLPLDATAVANASGGTYVSYLFASLPGISKVGSYTGNGSSQTIDCGFAAGARFVLIKRTDSTGNWVTFDTARGIVSGNDPALYLNSTAAEVTGIDGIDPDGSGFIVNQESTFNLNVNGASYIYLSVA